MYTSRQAFKMVHRLLEKYYTESPSRSLAFLVNGMDPSLFLNGKHSAPAIFQEWESLTFEMLDSEMFSLDDVLDSAVAFLEHEIHTFGFCQDGTVNEAGKEFARLALDIAGNREKSCSYLLSQEKTPVFSATQGESINEYKAAGL